MKWYQLGLFFGLTFAISWSIWIPMALASFGIRTTAGTVLNIVAATGTSLAALVLAIALGGGQLRELLSRFSVSRLSVRWSLVALGLPLAMTAVAITLIGPLGRIQSRKVGGDSSPRGARPPTGIFGWHHRARVLDEFIEHYHEARPHQVSGSAGHAKALALVRDDILYPGQPGCPITSPDTLDEVWLPIVGANNWVALM